MAQVAVEAEPELSVEHMAQKVVGALKAHPGVIAED
jgi:shikimate kinase (EC 2.7.1.71)